MSIAEDLTDDNEDLYILHITGECDMYCPYCREKDCD